MNNKIKTHILNNENNNKIIKKNNNISIVAYVCTLINHVLKKAKLNETLQNPNIRDNEHSETERESIILFLSLKLRDSV